MEFNDVHIPGTARKSDVTKNVLVRGNALKSFSTRQPASFEITAVGCTKDNIKINVFGPSKNLIPYRIFEVSSGIFQVEFKAFDVGNYSIEVFLDGNPLPGSPFLSKAYSSSQIVVKDVPQMCVVGQTSQFQVDVSQAGEGQLEISVNNGKTPNKVQVVGNNLCLVSFQPEVCGPQAIDIRFNGENVPGCPIILEAIESSSCLIEVTSQDLVPINRVAYFNIDVKGRKEADLKVSITGPNQTTLKSFIHGNYRNGYRVEYTPTEVGDHAMDITIDGQAIASSPYLVKVYDASLVKISDIGSGIVDKPVYFIIDASQSGAGNLEIIVSVDGKNVPNYVQSEGNAKFRVNFKPTKAQTHMLSVKFNGEPVPGSPCYIKVIDDSSSVVTGSCLKMTSVSQGAQFKIDTGRLENGVCKVTATGPTTQNIPVIVLKTSSTTFDVSFKPLEVGIHHVSVTVNDIALPGSPFMCNVYDVSKVKVSKSGPGIVGKPCTFQVDASQAGEGTLELVVTTKKSSVKAEVSMRSRGLYDVTFVPQDKLSHYVNIVFNGEDVPGMQIL